MALNKQRILSELGSVVNQLQSAECGCMGKLFSGPGQGSAGTPMQSYGGCQMGGCCHGHGSPYSGEPYSSTNNQFMHRPCMGMGRCNPPKLYADTYNYLNKNLMQPVVDEVYNDLKSISPANTIMNNPMGAKMGLSPTNQGMAGQGDMTGMTGGTPNQLGMAAGGMDNAKANTALSMSHQNQYMGQMSQSMGQANQPMGQIGQSMGHMSQSMDQLANQAGGMGAQIVSMMMGDKSAKPANMPVQNGQLADSMLINAPQSPHGQVGVTPLNAGTYGTNATMSNATMPNANYAQDNTGGYTQNLKTQYISQPNTYAGNEMMNNMPKNNMDSAGGMGQNMQAAKPMAHGQHGMGIKKFNEMFPGVMQGDLGFDPMAIAIQMNPANQQKAAMSTMQKLMNGNKIIDPNNSVMQPVINAANVANASLDQSAGAPTQGAPMPQVNQQVMQSQVPNQNQLQSGQYQQSLQYQQPIRQQPAQYQQSVSQQQPVQYQQPVQQQPMQQQTMQQQPMQQQPMQQQPIQQQPMQQQPIQQQPMQQQPMQQQPMQQQPMQQQPMQQQPMQQQPMQQQPMQQQPMQQQPMQQQPMQQQPMQQQPMQQQPMQQQPMQQQPMQQQPMQQQAFNQNTGAYQIPQQQVYTAVTGSAVQNQQAPNTGVYQQPQQYQTQQYGQITDPNTGAITNYPMLTGGYGQMSDNQMPQGAPRAESEPPHMIMEPIFPADTAKNRSLTYSHHIRNQKNYNYNTLGQPVQMVDPQMYHTPEPPLPQTLSPQTPVKPKHPQAFSNVKNVMSKTSIMAGGKVGRTPSKGQLQHLYNQYKGSHSFTQQNINAPIYHPTHSEGKLNENVNAAPRHVPVERVGGDTVANNIVNNQVMSKLEQPAAPIGDVAAVNRPQGDGAVIKQEVPMKIAKGRNGLQDIVYTSGPTSAAWTFHGNNRIPFSAGYRFRSKIR